MPCSLAPSPPQPLQPREREAKQRGWWEAFTSGWNPDRNLPIFISSWWPLFSSPSLESECLEGGPIPEDVELLSVQVEDYHPVNPSEAENKKEPYGGEELRAPCLLLAGDWDRDLDLERERLRDDLDRLLDLKTGVRKTL